MTRILRTIVAALLLCPAVASAQWLLVPMDLTQTNHLKAYGHAFAALQDGGTVDWLLNYRGGSFLMRDAPDIRLSARLRGVRFEAVDDAGAASIRETIRAGNMEEVLLEKPPRIAVYVPPNFQPWDDAVTLALTYAEIPYDTVFDAEVLADRLSEYDWLHLHHEDFTGQFGKFHYAFGMAPWYLEQKGFMEELARTLGFASVWKMKHAVALKIRDYVEAGGFLFAMCSATDTIDIALSYLGVDIVPAEIDDTPLDADREDRRDDGRTFAFEGFSLVTNIAVYEFSDIDTSDYSRLRGAEGDYFTLFDFAAKHDPVPAMLTQCHVNVINGFMGQTTGFHRARLKRHVIVLAQVEGTDEIRYLHGKRGMGTFTFLGGHDPEDYQHAVGDPPTDLDLYRSSPGYRLILNNILFPAARKKPQKT
ncbi:asparagine synthetase B [bacterium]|nr:asparagine synthetase B [bacterium]MBU1072707.1 asparagine synthetase B [bacterium]MBU1677123.1 asparagine synthetase B [bacterium]